MVGRQKRPRLEPTFRVLLARLLEDSDLSRVEIAQVLGKKSPAHVARLLQGAVPPPDREGAERLADAFDVDRELVWASIVREKTDPDARAFYEARLEEERRLAAALEPGEMEIVVRLREVSRRLKAIGVAGLTARLTHDPDAVGFELLSNVLDALADERASDRLVRRVTEALARAESGEMLLLLEVFATAWEATDLGEGTRRQDLLRRLHAAIWGLSQHASHRDGSETVPDAMRKAGTLVSPEDDER